MVLQFLGGLQSFVLSNVHTTAELRGIFLLVSLQSIVFFVLGRGLKRMIKKFWGLHNNFLNHFKTMFMLTSRALHKISKSQ